MTSLAGGVQGARAGFSAQVKPVLLGALSTAFPYPADAWLEVITRFVPAKTARANQEAFRQGRLWTEQQGDSGPALDPGWGTRRRGTGVIRRAGAGRRGRGPALGPG